MTEINFSEDGLQTFEMYHHGILGQKHGVRNGPPYPLDAEDHSAAEKKAGWRKSLDKITSKFSKKKSADDDQNVSSKRAPVETEEEREARIQRGKAEAMISGDPTKIKEFASSMTNNELQQAINRMNMLATVERNQPVPEPVQSKMDKALAKVDETAEKINNTVRVVNNGINAYNNVAKIYNKFNSPPMPVFDQDKEARDKAAEKAKRAEEVEKLIRTGNAKKILDRAMDLDNNEMNAAIKRINSLNTLKKFDKDQQDENAKAISTLQKLRDAQTAKKEEKAAKKEADEAAAKKAAEDHNKDLKARTDARVKAAQDNRRKALESLVDNPDALRRYIDSGNYTDDELDVINARINRDNQTRGRVNNIREFLDPGSTNQNQGGGNQNQQQNQNQGSGKKGKKGKKKGSGNDGGNGGNQQGGQQQSQQQQASQQPSFLRPTPESTRQAHTATKAAVEKSYTQRLSDWASEIDRKSESQRRAEAAIESARRSLYNQTLDSMAREADRRATDNAYSSLRSSAAKQNSERSKRDSYASLLEEWANEF